MATDPGESMVTAGELALGVLEGDERASALHRVIAEPAFARKVEWWREQFVALFEVWPEEAVPPETENRIMASIEPRQSAPQKSDGWWRITALAASLVAAVSVGALVMEQRRPVPAPPPRTDVARPASAMPGPLLAAIGTAKDVTKPVLLAAVYDPVRRTVRIVGTIEVPDRRVAELWAIGPAGKPRPLGLLARDPATRLTLGEPVAAGDTLAVSIEPVGGSPTGQPTGPVVATGPLLET